MTNPMVGAKFAEMSADAHQLQVISDNQATLVSSFGQAVDDLNLSMCGPAGTQAQALGAHLKDIGRQLHLLFADTSDNVATNRAVMESGEESNTHIVTAVGANLH